MAPSPGRGPEAEGPEETQMRPRSLDPQKARPRKGWEEAPKPSPERVLGVLRGFGEVFKGLGKVLKGFGEVLERFSVAGKGL